LNKLPTTVLDIANWSNICESQRSFRYISHCTNYNNKNKALAYHVLLD